MTSSGRNGADAGGVPDLAGAADPDGVPDLDRFPELDGADLASAVCEAIATPRGRDPDTEATRCDWQGALAFADANDVAIPVLERLREATTGVDARYVEAELRRRRASYDRFELDRECLHERFEEHGLAYAIVKTRTPWAYHPWDLNVLVADRDGAVDLLADLGYERTTLVAHPLARLEPGKWLYEHDVRHAVHLHTAVSWNGLTYLAAEEVLSSRVQVDGAYYPEPLVDGVIHCAHTVFETFELTAREAVLIAATVGAAPRRGRELARSHGWEAGFDLALGHAIQIADRLGIADHTADRPDHPSTRSPATAELPYPYPKRALLRAWIQHARHPDGAAYEPLANVALSRLK